MTKQGLPKRSQVPISITWDLSDIYSNDEACKKAQTDLKEKTKKFLKNYQGKIKILTEPDILIKTIKDLEDLYILAYKISGYVSLNFSTDMRNDKLGKWNQEVNLLLAEFSSDISFFESELAQIDESVIQTTINQTQEYKYYLKNKLEEQNYLFNPETEKVLAALEPAFALPYSLYETIKAQDMNFPNFTVDDKEYPLSYVAFENNYSREKDPEIRRQAFKVFSQTLEKYHNTNAELMLSNFTSKEILAKLRGFQNATEAALFKQKSTRELYDRQIDLIMTDLAPHMRRYAKLIQKEYQLSQLHYSDLLLPLDPDYVPEVSIEEAKEYISDAMQIMGSEYHDMIMTSFSERWTDFAQNLGKSTGGFCAGIPTVHPYILLNWSGKLSEVFTLAHELGHASQDILVAEKNSLFEQDMPFYLIESPSTIHELLLADSLLKKNNDSRFRRWVISAMIGNTYYHNAVTHLLEAAFQRNVMDQIAGGQQLSANDLDEIYLDVLQKFWGNTLIIDDGAEKTWMRQPHYYMNLYSYTYSASLVVSTDFYLGLSENPEKQVAKWKNYLSTGGPLSVIEHAKLADVDLSSEKPLREMISFIGELIDQLEELSDI